MTKPSPLTVETYIDALPKDMRAAVLGIVSIKMLHNIALAAHPEDATKLELLALAAGKSVAGYDNHAFFDAMVNHAMILAQISEETQQ